MKSNKLYVCYSLCSSPFFIRCFVGISLKVEFPVDFCWVSKQKFAESKLSVLLFTGTVKHFTHLFMCKGVWQKFHIVARHFFLSCFLSKKKKAKQAKEIRRTLFFVCCSLISSFFQFMAVCYTTWCRRSKQNTTVKCNKNVYTRRTQEPFDNLFRCLSCVLLCSLTFLFRLGGRRRKNS